MPHVYTQETFNICRIQADWSDAKCERARFEADGKAQLGKACLKYISVARSVSTPCNNIVISLNDHNDIKELCHSDHYVAFMQLLYNVKKYATTT